MKNLNKIKLILEDLEHSVNAETESLFYADLYVDQHEAYKHIESIPISEVVSRLQEHKEYYDENGRPVSLTPEKIKEIISEALDAGELIILDVFNDNKSYMVISNSEENIKKFYLTLIQKYNKQKDI